VIWKSEKESANWKLLKVDFSPLRVNHTNLLCHLNQPAASHNNNNNHNISNCKCKYLIIIVLLRCLECSPLHQEEKGLQTMMSIASELIPFTVL